MKKKTSILMLMLVAIMAITLVGCGKSEITSKKDSDKKETTVVSDNDKTHADDKKDELQQSSEKVTEKVTEAPTEPEVPKDYRYDIEKVMSSSRFENASFLVNEDGMVITRAPYAEDGNVTPIGERYGVSVMSTCDKLYHYFVDNELTYFSATTITELGLDDGYDELKANDESNLQFYKINERSNEFSWNEDYTDIDEEIADIYVLAQVTNPDEIAKYAALAGYDNAVVVKAYYSTSDKKYSLDKSRYLCDITDIKNLVECENAFTVTYIIDMPSSIPFACANFNVDVMSWH